MSCPIRLSLASLSFRFSLSLFSSSPHIDRGKEELAEGFVHRDVDGLMAVLSRNFVARRGPGGGALPLGPVWNLPFLKQWLRHAARHAARQRAHLLCSGLQLPLCKTSRSRPPGCYPSCEGASLLYRSFHKVCELRHSFPSCLGLDGCA